MSLTIKQGGKFIMSINDSIRLLPSGLAKLAKDFQVITQKDHFPHYFFLGNLETTLKYTGSLPEYKNFEPKRTSQADYFEMVQEFKGKTWSFLEVSKNYIEGDVKALYQVLLSFFEALDKEFPVNPMTALSAPSLAFRIWRTVQLPLLNKDGLKVYDLARTLDSKFREAYLGGIVDVYKPHLIGEGYYYDVNSLYPTAMCEPMPVGFPTLVKLTPTQFLENDFFGFLEATVEAPNSKSPGGYIGLLPIKQNGRLICPGGIFSGFFFSEELKLALKHGYTLLNISQAYSFQRGVNTFKDLIEKLNSIKVEAQLNNKPTIRNIAKLLMNSMYARFGMHTDDIRQAIVDSQTLNVLKRDYNILEEIELGFLTLVKYSLVEIPLDVSPNKEKTWRNYYG
jgi:DNA polymerase type B, organellar and viral